MKVVTTLPQPSAAFTQLQDRWREDGYWVGTSLAAALETTLSRHGSTPVQIWSHERPYQSNYSEILQAARCFAEACRSMGIGEGDRIVLSYRTGPSS